MQNEERRAWIGLVPIPWIYFLLGAANRWSQTRGLMQEYSLLNGFIPLIVIAICLVVNFRFINKPTEEGTKLFKQ